ARPDSVGPCAKTSPVRALMCTGISIRKCSTCAERVGNRKRQRAARGLPLSFPTAGGSGLVGVQIDTGTARCQDVVRVYRTLDGVLQIPFGLAVALGHTLLEAGVDPVYGVTFLLELVQQFGEAGVGALGFFLVGAIVQHVDDVVHVTRGNDELRNIVQAVLVQDALGHGRLFAAFAATGLTDRREPHGATAPTPVVQTELLQVRHTGHQLGAVLEGLLVPGLFLGDDATLAELLELVDDDLPVDVDLLLGAVQCRVQVPGTHAGVLLDLLLDLVGGVARLGDVVGTTHVAAARFPEDIGDHRRVGDDPADTQWTQDLDDLDNVFLVLEDDLEGLEYRRLGHQPEAHLGADTVVGLGEHAVQGRAIAPLEDLPGVAALHATHAGAIDITVGQYHFHAALHHEVLTVGGVTHTTVHGVAHRAGKSRRCGEGHHDRQVVCLTLVVHLTVGHARLDQCVAHFRVDLDDLVHFLQVKNDRTALPRGIRAITEVAAGGDGPDRNAVLVTDLHYTLDLFHGGGGDCGGGRVGGVLHGHHDLVVGNQLLLFHQHVLVTQQGAELLHRCVEFLLRHAAGQYAIVLFRHGSDSFRSRSKRKRGCHQAARRPGHSAERRSGDRHPANPADSRYRRPTGQRGAGCAVRRTAGGPGQHCPGAPRSARS